MTKDKILGIVRHVLTFGGGYLAASGKLEPGEVETIVGAVITLIGAVWSFTAKKKPVES